MKCSYYLLFLGIHIKEPQTKVSSQCKIMEGQEEDLSEDLELLTLDNHLHRLPNLQDCKLILQNKEDCKSPDVQRVQLKTLHYLLQVHLLNNAITSFSSCTHQKLTDASLTILITNMQGRILKEKLKDTNGMRQGRNCSIQRMTNLKIVSNLQFLVIHFYSYYISFIHINIISCMPKNFC